MACNRRPRVRISASGILALVLLCQTIAAADTASSDEQERMSLMGGAWHAGRFVPCADGVVTSVHPRLDESGAAASARFASGVGVDIKLPTVPRFLNGQPFPTADVVRYEGDRGNKLMESEKPGDKVQVCLVAFPTPTRDPQTGKVICDPNVDARGMVYRVYDYGRHAAYMGPDSQHSCGGA